MALHPLEKETIRRMNGWGLKPQAYLPPDDNDDDDDCDDDE